VNGHDPRACLCATHRRYMMDCETFDALWKRARGRCEICEIRSERTPHGVLHIDHDPLVGRWGVRGLLCSRCNSALHLACLDPKRVAAYLGDPYWKHILDAHGVAADGIPEPGIGAIVRVGRTLAWQRTERGWEQVTNLHWKRGQIEPWRIIATYYGPHRVRVISDPVRTSAA